ncbi:MAG: hypothetical protein JRM86_03110 [Nitrososphaerota archaeon]|nr:hypothetical protein [Nitrososphaerota archaeon]MDG6967753.1 hypothetical protein [Nitrososphaerota archaeon]MDG6977875.1 hypothetical protein [Nitrososphaerota archaeon]MDG7005904.1 hypothetical protein [Nitrososphaerota archaeon]
MRKLVLASALLVLAGFLLLLPSSQFWSLLSPSSSPAPSATAFRFALSRASGGSSSTTNDLESIVGLGAVAVGLILEVFSMFTDVGGRARVQATAAEEKV